MSPVIFGFIGHPDVQPRHYTAEEYFALEAASESRHEFFEGEVVAMAGASIAHNTLAGNLYIALRQGLRGKKCRVQMEAVRLAVEDGRHYAYPNVLVSCDPHDQRESQQLHSPVLIVEVLSPSTASYDRGLKFKQYQKLPSLLHYLLVAQTTWCVEWYRRNEADEWVIVVLTEPQEVLAIAGLHLHLPVPRCTRKAEWRSYGRTGRAKAWRSKAEAAAPNAS